MYHLDAGLKFKSTKFSRVIFDFLWVLAAMWQSCQRVADSQGWVSKVRGPHQVCSTYPLPPLLRLVPLKVSFLPACSSHLTWPLPLDWVLEEAVRCLRFELWDFPILGSRFHYFTRLRAFLNFRLFDHLAALTDQDHDSSCLSLGRPSIQRRYELTHDRHFPSC